jgi:hypothetical protein
MVPATLIRRRRTGRIASNEMCNVRISAENAGVALQDVAERAQHTDFNTTCKHYTLPSLETLRRVAKQRVAHRQFCTSRPQCRRATADEDRELLLGRGAMMPRPHPPTD